MTPNVLRRWVNWALVVAAMASVGAAVATRNTWTSAERMVRGNHLVVGYRGDDIRGVTLLSGGQKFVLARGDMDVTATSNGAPRNDVANRAELPESDDGRNLDRPRWEFVEPYQGEAEDAAVDSLLRAIEFAPFLRKVDDATLDRRAAGLDAPLQTIELEMGDVRTRLHVGAVAPTPANARYVEVGGEGTANKGVYVVSETTAKELLVRLDTFRVRQVVPYGTASLAKVTLRNGEKEVVLHAGIRGDWRVEKAGRSVRLDRDAARRLFGALSRSHAEQFVPQGSKLEVNPDSVEATFVPKAKDKAPLTVRFGGPCPTEPTLDLAVSGGTPPVAACTIPLHLDTFVAQLPELVDRHLFGQDLDTVEELQMAAGERKLELARRQDGWAMRLPQSGVVERDVGDAFVTSILDAQGELTVKPETALTEIATLSVLEPHSDDQREQRETISVFAPSAQPAVGNGEERLFVHRNADDAWLALSTKHRTLFAPNALLLEATQLLSLDAEQVASVRIETPGWVQAFEYAGQPASCRLSTPHGYEADSALCLDVIDELRVLRAKRWVAERDDGTYGLGGASLRVAFTIRGKTGKQAATAGHPDGHEHDHADDRSDAAAPDTRERMLLIGSRTPDGAYYAQLSPGPAVFTLRPSVVDALSTLVVDRAPFLFDPQTAEVVTVRTMTREVSLRRLGDELIGTEVADKVALLDSLSMVRPEGAVALLKVGQAGSAAESYGFGRPLLDVKVTRRVEDQTRDFRWIVGRGDVYRDVGIYYAMPITSAPSAVFALPREVVQRILDAL